MSKNTTVPAWLRERANTDPDRDFVACGGDWLSAGHVRRRARSLATGLYRSGVRPGDRIASIMTNRPETFDLFFACAELGAVHVPLNVYLKGEFLRYQLVDAAPSTVVADAAAVTAIRELARAPELSGAQLVTLDDPVPGATGFEDLVIEAEQLWPEPTPEDLACILYTSGTTGAPKGCMVDAGYLVNMSRAHLLYGWFESTDTSLCPLPLYHGFAISALMDALVAGCRVGFDPVFSASGLFDRARALGATQIFGVGAMATATLGTPVRADDTHHTVERAVFIPAAPQVQQEFEDRFGCRVLCEGYGQTEVVPATMGAWSRDRLKPSAGRAVPWLDVRIVDATDRLLPPGESGEIVVRPLEPHSRRRTSTGWARHCSPH
ncbi:class I adenylate-forming enzyme family protein [Nocardia sp. alder85J]|uniref:class I adenylate-forming enzyme family protein n=1 Tax=Nocardia sp. alder85J TaxID=2862949 RepID=UPI001CD326B7|nr:class I adenylate-forming enzyme family protein [Nocardia sp. alder85J]MCX4099163.1 class I adenylate-forming enzyme family protein [Nocardia sp. alder85J]